MIWCFEADILEFLEIIGIFLGKSRGKYREIGKEKDLLGEVLGVIT